MSFDMSCNGYEVNWFRNPFSLEAFLRVNCAQVEDETGANIYLHTRPVARGEVDFDRGGFLSLCEKYAEAVEALEEAYIRIDLPAYLDYMDGKRFPRQKGFRERIKGAKFDERGAMLVPVELFAPHYSEVSLKMYKEWMLELLELAQYVADNPDEPVRISV
jgi:hypothetical protein